MKNSSMHFAIQALAITLVAGILAAPISRAQKMQAGPSATQSYSATDGMQTELHMLTDVQTQGVDHKELDAYKAFFHENEDMNKKIQLGQTFLQKYPKSSLAEAVAAGLVSAYFNMQDWKDFYSTADQALTLKPDDVDVLTNVGWVIPHFYNPHDDNADEQLNKAETCEKHAIQVMATMPKPASMTDAQFAALKAQKANQAHSALGLVYFRRDDYANSLTELQQATQNNPNADQTDLFVLGMDFQNLNRFPEAANAFGRCGQIAGGLQDRCKGNADMAKKQTAQPK